MTIEEYCKEDVETTERITPIIELIAKYNNTTLAMPDGLVTDGINAWHLTIQFFEKNLPNYIPPNKVFYSPKEWGERGEDHGYASHLVIVHEEGDHNRYFSWELGCYDDIESYQKSIGENNLYCEQCTTWYSAIYSYQKEVEMEIPLRTQIDLATQDFLEKAKGIVLEEMKELKSLCGKARASREIGCDEHDEILQDAIGSLMDNILEEL